MKKFLIAGSSLSAVAAAGAAGAVDVTLGGSIDMGVEFGVGKNQHSLTIGDAYNSISLSIAAAGTTDGGMKYGGSFTLATAAEIEFDPYGEDKKIFKFTAKDHTDLQAAVYNVSGGQKIDANNIVGVKINSSWHLVSDHTRTAYGYSILESGHHALDAEALCKIAGRVEGGERRNNQYETGGADLVGDGIRSDFEIARYNAAGTRFADVDVELPRDATDGYLPGGVLMNSDDDDNGRDADGNITGDAQRLTLTMATSNLGSANVQVIEDGWTDDDAVKGELITFDQFDVRIANSTVDGALNAEGGNGVLVEDATVFAGPFAEVRLQSSSTKMVIGAVCVSGQETSETGIFMNNVTKIVTASDASIYIEGGFGKLTLQTGDYAGGVSAIGDAGDQADIGADGLVAIVEGVGLLGANPYLAADLASGRSLNSLEIITGGTIDLGGLSAAVDIELGNNGHLVAIDGWDLGLDYAMGDMGLAFVVDSHNDWGMSASMDVAGFGVAATIYNKAAADHKKTGLFYDVTASTSLNGFGLSLGVDQDMQPTVNLSKSMGGLSIYAGYDAADNGGKVGATLSF